MKYAVVIAQSAQEEFGQFDARWRAALKAAMREHLENEPRKESKSRIRKLQGLRQPQYRLRVGEVRVFYDVNDALERVEVVGFVARPETKEWLEKHGVPE